MDFYEYLKSTFGANEPIFISDIQFKSYSKPWIAKELAKLCESGQLARFERGVYYVPTKTPFGKSILSPQKVIERKYISESGERFGFYSGLTAMNLFGLSMQVPNVTEICTNNETTKLRNVKVGNVNVILRRSRTEITSENADILSFLELMNQAPIGFFDDDKRETMSKWLKDKEITGKSISQYAKIFPDKALRNLVESGVIYDVAQ